MTAVPGLNDEWADRQLDLLALVGACPSCTIVVTDQAQVGQPFQCDPDRPGCPLHDVPEVSR